MNNKQNQPRVQIFVGNLDYGATEDDIAKTFIALGVPIDKVRIPCDSNRSKGFAFVDIADSCDMDFEQIKEVLEGTCFNGRPCRIDRPKERPRRAPSSPNHGVAAADRQREQQRDRNESQRDRGQGRRGRRNNDAWERE